MEVYKSNLPDEDFMMKAYNSLTVMRLIAEGARYFYEERAMPLYHMAREKEMTKEMEGFNHIGDAIYDLRAQIIYLQEEYRKAIIH